jgi:hypothetical protein
MMAWVMVSLQLPLLSLDGNEELLDTLEGQLVTLDQDADRIAHELRSDFQHLGNTEKDSRYFGGGISVAFRIRTEILSDARTNLDS